MAHNGESDFRLDFAGIGVAKSGTTWLYHCLREHPAICMAGKEQAFFTLQHPMRMMPVKTFRDSSRYHLGIEWYKNRFAHRQPGQLLGEFSVAYFGDPETPRLLYEHNPQMKLIGCYRNPVDAMHSLYYQVSHSQPIDAPFEEVIKRPEMIDYFRYYDNTLRFLERFPREQVLLLLYDDIKDDPEGVFVSVCRFLGVDDSVRPESLHRKLNIRRVIRYKKVRDLRCRLSAALGSNSVTRRLRTTLARMGVARLVERLFQLNEKPGVYEAMKPETRAAIVELFREQNLKFAGLISRDLSRWCQVGARLAEKPAKPSSYVGA